MGRNLDPHPEILKDLIINHKYHRPYRTMAGSGESDRIVAEYILQYLNLVGKKFGLEDIRSMDEFICSKNIKGWDHGTVEMVIIGVLRELYLEGELGFD